MSSYLVIFHNTHYFQFGLVVALPFVGVSWELLPKWRRTSGIPPPKGCASSSLKFLVELANDRHWHTPLEWLENALLFAYQKKSKTTKKISAAANFQLHQIIESRIRIPVFESVSARIRGLPVCTCTLLRWGADKEFPPFSSFSISKNSLCLWRLLRFVVRLLPTFNYLESFHILNLLACCLCPDFFCCLHLLFPPKVSLFSLELLLLSAGRSVQQWGLWKGFRIVAKGALFRGFTVFRRRR